MMILWIYLHPGIEHFYSRKKPDHGFRIIVNGREKQWTDKVITYDQVVKLAFENYVESPDVVYTVDYVDWSPSESLGDYG